MRNNNIKPTQPYPKILWYQVKKQPPTEKQQKNLYEMYYNRSYNSLLKSHPTASSEDIKNTATKKATDMLEKDMNKPEELKKVVVNNINEHSRMVNLVQNSDDFIQWYKK